MIIVLSDNCNFGKVLYIVEEGNRVKIELNFTKTVKTTVRVKLEYDNISPTTGK